MASSPGNMNFPKSKNDDMIRLISIEEFHTSPGGNGMDERLKYLEKYFDARFYTIDARFDGVEQRMEDRFKAVDARFERVDRDISDVKTDVREIRKRQEIDFRMLFGALIFVALGLAGLMAKGFHWF